MILNTSSSKPKSHLPTVCNPTSPTCCDSGLPTHITSHRTESTGSSKTSSTSCPRFSLKLPRNLNPSSDLSTIRHENIFWTPLRVMTRLARFFVTIRLDPRRPWIGELVIHLPLLRFTACGNTKHFLSPSILKVTVLPFGDCFVQLSIISKTLRCLRRPLFLLATARYNLGIALAQLLNKRVNNAIWGWESSKSSLRN